MFIPNPYFKNVPQMGNLVLDYIFIEDGYPILFTCKNDEKIYLCLCRTLINEQKWVISEISYDVLEKLINNKVTIYDALKNSGKHSCIACWKKEYVSEKYTRIPSKKLDDSDLPPQDMFLDDEGESVDYLATVKNRLNNFSEMDCFYSESAECAYFSQTVTNAEFDLYKKLFAYDCSFKYNLQITSKVNISKNAKMERSVLKKHKMQNVIDDITNAA